MTSTSDSISRDFLGWQDAFGWRVRLLDGPYFLDVNYCNCFRTGSGVIVMPSDEKDDRIFLRLCSRDGFVHFDQYWPGTLRVDYRKRTAEYGPFREEIARGAMPITAEEANSIAKQAVEWHALKRSLGRRSASHVYFIQRAENKRIKIGLSVDVHRSRLPTLDTGSDSKLFILATIPGDKKLEGQLHQRFKHLNVRGEWFSPGEDLLAFIKQIQDA